MQVVVDEVDDFLDRDKLVFNICTNQSNAFNKSTLEAYFEVYYLLMTNYCLLLTIYARSLC